MPVTGEPAAALSRALGLPERGPRDLGTTIAVISPDVSPDVSAAGGDEDSGSRTDSQMSADPDATMRFLADAVVWNFWPRMVNTEDGQQATLKVTVSNNGHRIRVPDPRTHPRLRGFVDALDQLRGEPADGSDGLIIDRRIDRKTPRAHLGRLVVARGPLAPVPGGGAALTRGAREMRDGVHHVAAFRAPEIVVRYLRGDPPAHAGDSYAGVFRCSLTTDAVFKAAEPPTHDDWVPQTVQDRDQRSLVRVALDKIRRVCREAAGTAVAGTPAGASGQLPLGELSDSLGRLLPALAGSGSRLPARGRSAKPTSGSGHNTQTGTDTGQKDRDGPDRSGRAGSAVRTRR